MAILSQRDVELRLDVGAGAGLCPGSRSPPSGSRGKELPPGIEPLDLQPQLLGDDRSSLAAGNPIVHCFALEGFIELSTINGRCFIDGLDHTRFAPFSVHHFEATSDTQRESAECAECEDTKNFFHKII